MKKRITEMTDLIIRANNGALFLSKSQVAKTLGRSVYGIQGYLYSQGIQAYVIGSTKKYCARDIAEIALNKTVVPFEKLDDRGKESSWDAVFQ